jgi:hypothetical protein
MKTILSCQVPLNQRAIVFYHVFKKATVYLTLKTDEDYESTWL